ncbi:MAG TPA: hypothetical protein VM864_04370 [Pyrinomonadaceae bacterium]|jgi:hypothetical protein|nr:hypothetical protein [Pyrinomonadaceae bacterium]
MKSHRRILSGVLICAAAITAFAMQARKEPRPPKFVPYTILWRMRERYVDGRIVDTYVERRSYSSDGNWRGFVQSAAGSRIDRVGEAGRGVFIVDGKSKEKRFHWPYPGHPRDKPKESKDYVRTEIVLGYSADVLRYEQEGKTHELYRAPDLNGDIIKTVYRDKDVTRTLEPVSIIPGEPPPE